MANNEKGFSLKEILLCLFFATILHWCLFEFTKVPTTSMANTIKPDSYLLISKIHYGPRIPITPLQVPLTHQTIPLLNIKSYLDWIKLPYYRLPGITKIKRNDIVTFNTPKEKYNYDDKIPIDLKTFYVKRCLGLPGEKIKMINNNVFINEEKIENDPKSLCKIEIKLNNIQKKKIINFLKNKNIDYENSKYSNSIIVNIDESTKETLKKEFKNLEYSIVDPDKDNRPIAFIKKLPEYKDVANWGEFLIPKKGMGIEINKDNLEKYGEIIKNYDSDKKIILKNKKLFMNDKEIKKYIFKKNYYFMIGDNRMNSLDSRFIGPVPEDHIYSKVVFIFSNYFKIFINFLIILIIIYLILILFFFKKNN